MPMTRFGADPIPLADLSREELQALLERLAQENEHVAERLRYLIRPKAAARNIAARIAAVRSSCFTRSHPSAEGISRVLEEIHTDIERDVLPNDPRRALVLAHSLIELDSLVMEYESDYNPISTALKGACIVWLKAARAVRDQGSLPLMNWPVRLKEILASNDYGVRLELIEHASLLLDDSELTAVNEWIGNQHHGNRQRWQSGALRLTDEQEGWRYVKPTVNPNEDFPPCAELELARRRLLCGDVKQAIAIAIPLAADREARHLHPALDLLDEAYGHLGDTARRIEVRRSRFDCDPNIHTHRKLEELLDEPARNTLSGQIALKPPGKLDVVTAARLYFAARLPLLAQTLIVAQAKAIELQGNTFETAALGEEAIGHGFPLAATVVWRAFLNNILEEGRTKDYRIGGKLLGELERLTPAIDNYRGLPTHAEYEADLRTRHRMKTSFWRRRAV